MPMRMDASEGYRPPPMTVKASRTGNETAGRPGPFRGPAAGPAGAPFPGNGPVGPAPSPAAAVSHRLSRHGNWPRRGGGYGPGKMPDRTMPAAQRDTLAPWVLRVGMMTRIRVATRTPGCPHARRGTSRRARPSPGTPVPMIPPPTSSLPATGARQAAPASRRPGRPARPGQPPVPAGQGHRLVSHCRVVLRRRGTCRAAARRGPAPPGHPGCPPPRVGRHPPEAPGPPAPCRPAARRRPAPPGHPGCPPPRVGRHPPEAPGPPAPCRPAARPRPAPPGHPGCPPPRVGRRVAASRREDRSPRQNAPLPG